MFGDSTSGLPVVKICCGPRCGALPGHRGLYAAIEAAAQAHGRNARPVLCQGHCGTGVTVLLTLGGAKHKVCALSDATALPF